jgi:hypothetical protein
MVGLRVRLKNAVNGAKVHGRTLITTIAVVAAAFLGACGGGVVGGAVARREPAPPSAGAVLGQVRAEATSTLRPQARATPHRRATTVPPTPGHPIEIKASKAATRRQIRTIVDDLLASRHAHSRRAAGGPGLLAQVLKQRRGATARPVARSKKDLLSSITSRLQKPK